MTCLQYPIAVENGKLALTVNEPQKVTEALRQSLLTIFEERIRLPEYGLNLELFETVGSTRAVDEAIRSALEVGMEEYPIKNIRIRTEVLEGEVKVDVFYDYRGDVDLVEQIYLS